MRVPSIGPSGWSALGLALASAGLGGINAPAWAWIATLVLAVLCLLRAAHLHRSTPEIQPEPRYRPGDLARQHTSLGAGRQGSPGRVYGSAAIGDAIRRQEEEREEKAIFLAVEDEISLAHDEAREMVKMLCKEPPHTAVEAALAKTVLPDWRAKTTEFIGTVLGSAQRSAFKGAAVGDDELKRLESESRFLSDLALNLSPGCVRIDEREVLDARQARRSHKAGFLSRDNTQAPRGSALASLADQLDALIHEGMGLVSEFSEPVQPEQTNGVWEVSGGDAPQEWTDKALAFQQRSREVLETQHPALLADFRDGIKKHFQMEQSTREQREQESQADTRSDGEKMLALANHERSGPRREVEACLEGLALARKAI